MTSLGQSGSSVAPQRMTNSSSSRVTDATIKRSHDRPSEDGLQDATARLPGRPAKGENPMTPAQRQRAYRLRRKRAETDAIGEEAHASRVTLLAMLSRDLATLDDGDAARMHGAVRSSATRILRTIVTRYAIHLEGDS